MGGEWKGTQALAFLTFSLGDYDSSKGSVFLKTSAHLRF